MSVPRSAPAAPGGLAGKRRRDAPAGVDLVAIRAVLEADLDRLRGQFGLAQHDLADLVRGAQTSCGDTADVSAEASTADQESSVAANTDQALRQSEYALARLDAGTYGTCEACGRAIDPRRLQALPRATMCLNCKHHHEHHP